jgi:hypothetical protein
MPDKLPYPDYSGYYLVSSIGDMYLRDGIDKVYWLNSGDGTITQVAESIDDFKTKLQDPKVVQDRFLSTSYRL